MARHNQNGGRAMMSSARHRQILPALACAVAALFAVACGDSAGRTSSVLVEHEILPQPTKVGPATFKLNLTDADAKPVTGARISLEGNMTHAGMTPVFAVATEAEPGRYSASLEFTMGGDWVVLVHAALPDGQQLERQLDVKGVRAN